MKHIIGKLVVASILILLASLFPVTGSSAAPPNPSPPVPPQAIGVLTNIETGERFELPVSAQIRVVGTDKYEIQYDALIPSALLASYVEVAKLDSTASARVTIHQNFNEKYISGNRYVAINFYKGRWERLDSAVTATKLLITARCFGGFDTGGFCDKVQSRTVLNPGNGTWYKLTPSWAGKYVLAVDCTAQAGSTKVWLKRGSTTWTFQVEVADGGFCG